jgi:tRNA(Ile)-lysidine synthase
MRSEDERVIDAAAGAATLEARVRAGGLLAPDRPVVVLLSGGRDSVCLLDLAVRIAGRTAVGALHVDYALREESAADAAHCAALCDALGVELEVHRAGPPAGNVQAWAREERYAHAARVAARRDADVAAGHTATDQAETVLYRLAASPGRRALLGMAARDGRLVRPLLGVTREGTAAYCRERGLAWREDASNASPAYARNRVRHGLLAALRDVHPAAEANVLRTLALLRDEAAVLDDVVAGALAAAGDPLEQAVLAAMAPALARLALQAAADAAMDPDPAPAIAARSAELLALSAGRGTASLYLGGGLRAVAEYGRLRFELATAGALAPVATILTVPGRAAFAGGELRCERGTDLPLADGTLAADALGGRPLTVRAWRPGDRMRPLGLGGSRTLQDLFTDRKVPRLQRASWPVVTSGEEIAWVPGVATAERFRVTSDTRERVRLSWRRSP